MIKFAKLEYYEAYAYIKVIKKINSMSKWKEHQGPCCPLNWYCFELLINKA